MKNFKSVMIVALLLLGAQLAAAQSLVVNTPSTDVVEEKRFHFEVDFNGHFGKSSEGGFHDYGVHTIYGLGRNVEIGANFYYKRSGEHTALEFVPNIKWKAYENEKHKVAVSGGAMLSVPVKDEEGARPEAFVYANASKEFDFAKGFRLTGGVYSILGAKSDSGNKSGVMIGYEQTVYKKLTFMADWTSGNNKFSNTGVGLNYNLTKKDFIYAGYSFGNTGRGNNFLTVSYGRSF